MEVATSLVLGGKPIVGYSAKSGAKVHVLQDFDLLLDDWEEDNERRLHMCAPTLAAAHKVNAKEIKRVRDQVPPTSLEPGEAVIVPHWEVAC